MQTNLKARVCYSGFDWIKDIIGFLIIERAEGGGSQDCLQRVKKENEENNVGWEQLKENTMKAGRDVCSETKRSAKVTIS